MNDLKHEGHSGTKMPQVYDARLSENATTKLAGGSDSDEALRSAPGARVRILILTVFIALWLGGLFAYLWGYYGANLFENRDIHLWLSVAAAALGPIILFAVGIEIVIQGRALARTSQDIARITQRLSEPEGPALQRVALITSAVRRELDILSGSLDATLDRVAAVETLIENQVSAIERAGGRAQMRAQVISELLSKERDGLSAIADQMTANAARVADTIQSQAVRIGDANREAAQSILEAETSLTRQLEGLQRLTENHAKSAVDTVHEIESVAARLRDFSAASLESTRALTVSIESQHETLANTTQKLDRESQNLADVFEHQSRLIARIEEAAQNLAERLSGVLSTATARVDNMFGTLNTRTTSASEALRAETEAALIAGGNVASAIEQVAAKARMTSTSLRETISAQIEAFNATLSEGLRSLDSAATATGATLSDARSEADGFSKSLDDTVRGIEAAGRRLGIVLEGIGERSESTRETLDDASRALAHHMSEVPDLAAEHAARISALLEDQASRMAALANALGGRNSPPITPQAPTSSRLENAPRPDASAVIPLATAPSTPPDNAEDDMPADDTTDAPVPFAPTPLDQRSGRAAFGRIGRRLRRATRMGAPEEELPPIVVEPGDETQEHDAASDSFEHAARVDEALESAPDPEPAALPEPVTFEPPPNVSMPTPTPTSRGGFWSALFARIEGNDDAEAVIPQGAALAEPESSIDDEGEPRRVQHILETLYAIAIDLDRLLEEEPPIELWKRYRGGEADVFARRLLTLKGSGLIQRIRHKYRDDMEFREHADRYRARFEDTTELADTPAANLYAILEEALTTNTAG